jgi:hypothetical protein
MLEELQTGVSITLQGRYVTDPTNGVDARDCTLTEKFCEEIVNKPHLFINRKDFTLRLRAFSPSMNIPASHGVPT